MDSILKFISVNCELLVIFAAAATLFWFWSAGMNARWLLGRWKENRQAARIVMIICSASILVVCLTWLYNYDPY